MTTSKKTVAATTAASKSVLAAQVKMKKDIAALSAQFVAAIGTAKGVIEFDYVVKCRAITRDTKEAAVLLAKYSKQRRSDASALIALDDTAFEAMKSWAPKRRKLGLQIAGRCNKVAQIAAIAGFDPIHAADYIRTGKADSFTLAQGKALAVKKPAANTAVLDGPDTPDVDAPRDVQLPVHNGKGKTPYMLMEEALAAMGAEVAASKSKEAAKVFGQVQGLMQTVIAALAKG